MNALALFSDTPSATPWWLWAACFLIAALYASVGHGGASGYLALMALAGLPGSSLRPTALILNIGVSAIATCLFYKRGHFSWRQFLPLMAASAPAAWCAGRLDVPLPLLRLLLALALVCAALRLFFHLERQQPQPPPVPLALGIGGLIGLISGLTGVGGGIFLTPLLLFAGWASPKRAAALSAPFILLNSLAGLLGHLQTHPLPPTSALTPLPWALLGGCVGSLLGSGPLPSPAIRHVLGWILVLASAKLALT